MQALAESKQIDAWGRDHLIKSQTEVFDRFSWELRMVTDF